VARDPDADADRGRLRIEGRAVTAFPRVGHRGLRSPARRAAVNVDAEAGRESRVHAAERCPPPHVPACVPASTARR
jgi:hypothetical protein